MTLFFIKLELLTQLSTAVVRNLMLMSVILPKSNVIVDLAVSNSRVALK
jgi:hypothetical protein